MRKAITFTFALLIAGSSFAAGEIWRWKDAAGTWHYSDQPQPGAELVNRAGRPATEQAAAKPAPPPAPSPAELADGGPPPVSQDVADQVRREAATAKAEQCKKAEEAYQQAVRARRILKLDGVTYMTDAEIDAERLRVRSVRDTACGPGA
jgi:hypothetical protein